jgi:hypothetical protein
MEPINLLDPQQAIPLSMRVEIASALGELTAHPAWPLLVTLARRKKFEMWQAEVRVEQSTARMAGLEDGIEMVLGIPDEERNHANDAQQALKAQEEAMNRQHLVEQEPNLSL